MAPITHAPHISECVRARGVLTAFGGAELQESILTQPSITQLRDAHFDLICNFHSFPYYCFVQSE